MTFGKKSLLSQSFKEYLQNKEILRHSLGSNRFNKIEKFCGQTLFGLKYQYI